MRELIQVELYKMGKKHCFFIIFLFNSISMLYGIGMLYNFSWVSFSGTFDLIQYVGAIWQLLFLIGLPLIFFLYMGASVLGGEKAEGQILLEITRVADRKNLVLSKILAVLCLILFYFVTNILISSVSYILFVRQTIYTTAKWIIIDKDNMELLILCLFGCIYMIISVVITMYLSIKYSAVIATILGIAFYVVMSLMARIPSVRVCVPGYFALVEDAKMGIGSILWQGIWCSVIVLFFMYLTRKKMEEIDL